MKSIGINIWAGNTVRDYQALAGLKVWHKLIDLPNARDAHFDAFWQVSKGVCQRGIFAFPDVTKTPVQNYDMIMLQYPAEDGELHFWLDMEKKNLKKPIVQADEMMELGLRLSLALGYWITIYSADWWWTPNIAPAKPQSAWRFEYCISDNRYNGLRIQKKISELGAWADELAGNDPMPRLDYAKRASIWQISIDRLNLKEISGDIDLLIIDEGSNEMILFYPVDEGKFNISQRFGENPQSYTQSKGHNGVDWAVNVGSKVYAMEDGEVIIAEERREKTGYGRQVRIKHPEGVSIYGHLSKLLVKMGDLVKGGQVIGLSGGAVDDPYSGNSSGPHLHAEYRLNSSAPQVPGGFVYNAIDIYPLLVSKNYGGPDAEPMYKVKTLISNLTVRRKPVIDGQSIRNAGLGEFSVFEELNGYGRINRFESEWIYIRNPQYAVKVPGEDDIPTSEPKKWAELGVDEKLELLRVRVGGID